MTSSSAPPPAGKQISLKRFLRENDLTRYQYYALKKKKLAPKTHRIGSKRYVMASEAKRWLERAQQGEFKNFSGTGENDGVKKRHKKKSEG